MKKTTLFLSMLLITALSFAQTPLSGDYYIQEEPHEKGFFTLTQAIDAVNENGLSGTVTFYVAYDLFEINSTAMLTRNDLSAVNNLVIKPAPTKTPIVIFFDVKNDAGANQYAGLTLFNTSFVTIDGSNTVGGTTQDMTFMMNDKNGRFLIMVAENSDNVTIKNLNLTFIEPFNTSYSRCVFLSGSETGAPDNFTLQNCTLGDAGFAPLNPVYVTSKYNANVPAVNAKFLDNKIFTSSQAISIYDSGTPDTSIDITGNEFSIIGGANTGHTAFLYFVRCDGNVNIANNKFPTISVANTVSATTAYEVRGVLSSGSKETTVFNIFNNFFGGSITSASNVFPPLITYLNFRDTGPSKNNVYHNTFYFAKVENVLEKSCVRVVSTTSTVNMKNNIIINESEGDDAYCVNDNTGKLVSDYNNYFATNSTACIGTYKGVLKKTLADWQTASGQDANSKSVSVAFENASAGSLFIAGASNRDNNLSVVPLAEVKTDILGAVREDPTYMGAHQGESFNGTGVEEQFAPQFKIYKTVNGIAVILDGESVVELLDINGRLMDKVNKSGTYFRDLQNGIYIVRVNGVAVKVVR